MNINTKYETISPEMKEAKRKMEVYSKRADFMNKEKIDTNEDLDNYIKTINSKINDLKAKRDKIRNKLRNCTNEDKKLEYKQNRDELTKVIKEYRKKFIFAMKFKEDIPKMQELVNNEITSIEREKKTIKRLKQKERERI